MSAKFMIEEIRKEDYIKHKQISELLTKHIEILKEISKECESLGELQELIDTLSDMSNQYHASKKYRDEMHFKMCD